MALTKQNLLDYIAAHPGAGREAIRRDVAPEVSPTTIWRALKRLINEGKLDVSGRGRATGYSVTGAAIVRLHLQTPYNRRQPTTYNKKFLDRYTPNKTFYIGANNRAQLHEAGRLPLPADTYEHRILKRLPVDLSWASSRMEGGTYDIHEAERLIRSGQEAAGKNSREAIMILNHKEAIQHVVNHLADITISRSDLFNIHAFLAVGLLADPAMAGRTRRTPVAIPYSRYRPLANQAVIRREFGVLVKKAAAIADPFEQSFFLLVHIPCLQAFEDINRRTSRVAANIPILKAGLAPMSFLAINDADYIDGLAGVYELNDVSLLQEAYTESYLASAENYRALRAEAEDPAKAALAYRDFVRAAVRRSVLEWKAFRPDAVMAMAAEDGIPEADREQVVDYIGQEFHGLHEGNRIRYRLRLEDLDGIAHEPAE